MERERIQVKVELPRCPFCHEDVLADQPKKGCEACFAWHHAECWDEGGSRCSACGVAPPDAEAPAPAEPLERRQRSWIRSWRHAASAERRQGRYPVGHGGSPAERSMSQRETAALGAGIAALLGFLGFFSASRLGALPVALVYSVIGLGIVFFVVKPGSEGRLWRRKWRGGKKPRKKEEPHSGGSVGPKGDEEP